ncbi:MAG: glycosyl transferase family 2 [Deltaproteobacteria bacterium RBG_19FT_COMBO_43_11]|nr:MAG: glycosyl transferase family 2 [Deltaproteobacteria bacterium RBG_19FT_COMBO_43_11]
MVSVIIPTLNEENSIAKVIGITKKCKQVNEVIVIDDHSFDNTVAFAKKAGASVIMSTKLGKGASMLDGLLVANNDILAYIDADIENYEHNLIDMLVKPIIEEGYDFVKSTFKRQAGRVTELAAKPLLSLLFPQALEFSQPLSGMIAGKRSFLEKVDFENDYGVDIGILLDMIKLGAKIKEVNIGAIENKMKQWQQLAPMAREVSKAILKRARLNPNFNLDTLQTTTVILDQMDLAVKESLIGLKKMVIFDMDNTILKGRYIYQVAEKFNFRKELLEIISNNNESYLITKMIARLLKGLNQEQLIEVADEIEIVGDTIEVIAELKKREYIVGIISDSYNFVASHVANKIGAHFSIANEPEFSKSEATGEVKILSYFMKTDQSKCNHNFCKSNALLDLSKKYNIPLANIIAIGDSENDICMVRHAGIGVAFCSDNKLLNSIADKVISERKFSPILEFAE